MQCFQGVTVGFPAGGRAPCAPEGLGATWVAWSTGELRIDPASYSLCFVPSGAAGFVPKPLGCLLGASATPGEPGGPSTIVARTNDLIHGLVRLGFEGHADEEGFMKLARSAEAKRAVARRSSRGLCGPAADFADGSEQLAEIIMDRCAGAFPLIYGGAELYGPDPCGDGGGEVLLGRGAVVLLDPLEIPGGDWTGTYDLLFYDETSGEPTLRVPVCPRMKLSQQSDADSHPGRLSAPPRASMARRLSSRPSVAGPSVAACFDFTVQGVNVSALTFDREDEANAFVRDVSVRLRLTRASLKAVHNMHSVGDLQGQLFNLRSQGIFAFARRWAQRLFVVVLVYMLFYGCILYFNEERPLGDVAVQVLGDTLLYAGFFGAGVKNVGSDMCQFVMGARTGPDMAALESCASMAHPIDAQACMLQLIGQSRPG